uniref:Uncharacterized mitochondrial protein AtMg00810-like n=1 Tax=Nicotiana tabacum TaxID=4097 RepID=A0A1S4AXS4_TOBAC|nr:PREDICTED: uncharacterized mitochondrial protein AtMg00810-like [Nicotiana tabacum]
MTKGKVDMMSQVKEPNEDNAASSSTEPSISITITEAEERVVDAVQGTPLVYVDDIIFGATTDSLCEEFAKLMGSKFEMSMMGELNFFLGLQVKQSPKDTSICLQKYIKKLLNRFDIEVSKVIDTPTATATRLDMDETRSPVNQTMYRGIIGSLLYLTASRPDIVFSVGLYYAGYFVDRKSTSGMAHFLRSCLISWGTRKQNSVALSTAEAEYVAAASYCA